MKKSIFLVLLAFIFLLFSSSSFAGSFDLKVDHIDCEKCVQKIHDYFAKNFGPRVQNLKIDTDSKRIKFESISVDSVEMENIRQGLELLGFKITPMASSSTSPNQEKI